MLRYDTYKESGETWIGEIPEHWEVARLGSYFEERRTKASDKEFEPLSVAKFGIIPRLENAAKSNDGDNRKLVREGDFVINSRSDRKGSSGIAYQDGSVSLINIVLHPKGIESLYTNYLLKGYSFIEEFYRNGHGIVADLWTTRYQEMKNIKIPVPPKAEQTAIANFLDRKTALIDRAVAQQERLIELLRERKQIVIQRAVTRGLDGGVGLKDSGVEWIGQVPGHWVTRRLKTFVKVQTGITLGKRYKEKNLDKVPYLRVANVQAGYFNLDEVTEIDVPFHEVSKYLLRDGDLLVTEGGDIDKLGRGSVWEGQVANCIHQNHVFAIRIVNDSVLPAFVAAVFGSDYGRYYFTHTANKTTNLASTNSTKLGNFPIALPPYLEMKEIMGHLSNVENQMDEVIKTQSDQITKLKEYRATLIDAAVTGKVRVG